MRTGFPAPIGIQGYVVAHGIAQGNLHRGHRVIADCVNSAKKSQDAWTEIAKQCRSTRPKSRTMHPDSNLSGAPILYSFRRCPYAIRARLAIKVSGVQVALREVVLSDKPAALRRASEKATVPVLQLPDGRVLEQSLEIMHWALAQHDPQGWLRLEEQAEALALIALNDGPFKQVLDRYKYAPRHPERPMHAWRDEAVELMLKPLNARLADRLFLLRDTPSLADLAIAPFIRQFAAVEPDWFAGAPLAPLQAWTNRIVASELFGAVMTKFTAWQPGDAETAL